MGKTGKDGEDLEGNREHDFVTDAESTNLECLTTLKNKDNRNTL